MNKRLKIILIAFIWVVLLSWYLRIFPFIDQPGMTGGYGVYHDWPRYHIVETGSASNIPDGVTEISNKMYEVNDLMTYLLAIYSIISGTTELVSGLRILHLLPNLAYFIPALLGISFYNRISADKSIYDLFIIFSLGLFITSPYIGYTTTAINKAGYGLCFLSLIFYVMYRISISGQEKRWLIIFVILVAIMVSIYHTQGLVAIYLVPSFYVLKFIAHKLPDRWISKEAQSHSGSSLMMFSISFLIMISVGMYYSGLVEELVLNIIGIAINSQSSQELVVAAKQTNFFSSLNFTDSITESVSRISKILLRIIYVLFIGAFIMVVYWKKNKKYDIEEVFLSLVLIMFPLVLALFYSYGGLGIGVQRTIATGSAVIVLVISYILAKETRNKRVLLYRVGCVGIVILAVATQVGQVGEPNRYTAQEVESIQFTGEYVDTSEIIFSEVDMGSPLLYYNHRGVVFVRLLHTDWENRLQRIYFESDPSELRMAISDTIEIQLVKDIEEQKKNNHYVLITDRLSERGVSLAALTYRKKPSNDFTDTFDRGYDRVYDSGDGILYNTPSSSS